MVTMRAHPVVVAVALGLLGPAALSEDDSECDTGHDGAETAKKTLTVIPIAQMGVVVPNEPLGSIGEVVVTAA